MALAAAGIAVANGETDDAATKATELKALQQRIQGLQQELERDTNKYADSERTLRRTERKIGSINKKIRGLDAQLKQQEKLLTKLRKQERNQRQNLTRQRQLLAGQIRASYATGKQEYLKILLNQEDPASLGRILTYYNYFNRARSKEIGELTATIASIKETQQELRDEQQKTREFQQQRRDEKRDLTTSKLERKKLLNKLRLEISSKSDQLAQMQQNEGKLQQILQELELALEEFPTAAPVIRQPFAKLRGKLKWPIKGRHLHSFGSSRKLANLRWNGVVIKAKEGANIRSIAHGQVIFSDWLRGYGLLIIIDHGDGYMSLYGHNQSLFKDVGDSVERDEVIALIGSSGGSEQSALYFEIRHNSKPTNPKRWCKS
ncbi:MAG: peptidoglycan DD-metalloendopeptidase family protein [Gammaproteobacteria bacterium]|nr:peptidoglycan DD-metalloendopeptidase family protein [Gammaproteobacteria bacterium]